MGGTTTTLSGTFAASAGDCVGQQDTGIQGQVRTMLFDDPSRQNCDAARTDGFPQLRPSHLRHQELGHTHFFALGILH